MALQQMFGGVRLGLIACVVFIINIAIFQKCVIFC